MKDSTDVQHLFCSMIHVNLDAAFWQKSNIGKEAIAFAMTSFPVINWNYGLDETSVRTGGSVSHAGDNNTCRRTAGVYHLTVADVDGNMPDPAAVAIEESPVGINTRVALSRCGQHAQTSRHQGCPSVRSFHRCSN